MINPFALRATLRLGLPAALTVMSAAIAADAKAADFGGSCCVDLEERIAELEATAVRKGNRKVSLRVSGQIHQLAMFWDDGSERNTYITDTFTWSSYVRFKGGAKISPDTTVGFDLVLAPTDDLSGLLDQNTDTGGGRFGPKRSLVFAKHERLGQLSIGMGREASDGVAGFDYSGSDIYANANLADYNGSFHLRRPGGALSSVVWEDIISNDAGDGSTISQIIRYDSPIIAGFMLSGSWADSKSASVALRFEHETDDHVFGAAIGYNDGKGVKTSCGIRDGFNPGDQSCRSIAGSIGYRHVATGLNIHGAAGYFEDDINATGVRRFGDDNYWYYLKAGIYKDWIDLGATAFYAEHYHSTRSLENTLTGPNAFSAGDVFFRGADAQFWGIGLVQEIDAAAIQVYALFRHQTADLDVLDAATNARIGASVEDFDTFVAGARIEF